VPARRAGGPASPPGAADHRPTTGPFTTSADAPAAPTVSNDDQKSGVASMSLTSLQVMRFMA